jgi:hypothetical protein
VYKRQQSSYAHFQVPQSSFIEVIFHTGRLPFLKIFLVVFSYSRAVLKMLGSRFLLISSYFTTFPGGGAGYVVVVAQDMWWGKSKLKLNSAQLNWNWS